jgi:hypothetical protein
MKSGLRVLAAAAFPITLAAQPPIAKGDRSGKFKPGDMAADFNLKVMHKEVQVTLSGFRGQRPVALVFGSYT